MPAPPVEPNGEKTILLVGEDWEMDIGMGLTGAEARRIRAFIRSYRACFAFKLTDLEGYTGKPGSSWRTITQYFDVLTG